MMRQPPEQPLVLAPRTAASPACADNNRHTQKAPPDPSPYIGQGCARNQNIRLALLQRPAKTQKKQRRGLPAPAEMLHDNVGLTGRLVHICRASERQHCRGEILPVQPAGQFQGLALRAPVAKVFHKKKNVQLCGRICILNHTQAAAGNRNCIIFIMIINCYYTA